MWRGPVLRWARRGGERHAGAFIRAAAAVCAAVCRPAHRDGRCHPQVCARYSGRRISGKGRLLSDGAWRVLATRERLTEFGVRRVENRDEGKHPRESCSRATRNSRNKSVWPGLRCVISIQHDSAWAKSATVESVEQTTGARVPAEFQSREP